jgi:hypothetical protein
LYSVYIKIIRTAFFDKGVIVTVKVKKTRKKSQLAGNIHSGVLFIGDCQFFAGSPVLELDPVSGQTVDVTPKDPLNPFNTIDRTFDLVGDAEANVELGPYIPGRGVLLNTHLQAGSFIVKKKTKNGKLVGYTIDIKE